MDAGEPKTAGALLRTIRTRQNLSVEVVAGRAGVSAGLQQRVARVHSLDRQCRFQDVGQALPGLIRDLHTTLAAGRELGTLLPLAVLLHVRVTRTWLNNNVGFWRIRAALELGDVDDAIRSVRAVHPERTPFQASQAFYWRSTGRALTLAGGPVDDAIRAHLKAEAFLLPVKLYRNLRTREVLRNLLTRAPDNEQLQQLAQRASLDQR